MKNYSYLDEKGQISAEMILLIGALLIIVIVAGGYIFGITKSIGGKMHDNLDFELIVAREKRCDLLRRVEQYRLIHLVKAGHAPHARVDRQARRGLRIWMVRRKAVG